MSRPVHIDAPWGGGKTTFANFVARVLNPCGERLAERHFLRSVAPAGSSPDDLGKFKLDEIFFLHPDTDQARADSERSRWPEQARQPWIAAHYNAWRDQYVQPPWWHVFQTILTSIDAALKADIPGPFGFHSLWRLLKIKFVKLRYQVFNAKMRSQLNLIAFVTATILLAWWAGIFGGLLSYATEDVKKWVEQAVAILAIGGFSIATLLSILSQSFAPDLDFTAEHKQIGVRDPIGRFRNVFTRIVATVDRPVLLIVDDIDRCDPKTVVEVLRGFQTIVRSTRLFVLVLGDRSWIEKAHEIHHKDFVGVTVGSENTLGERFVEKIFQLSFTLPAMTPEMRDRFTRTILGMPVGAAGETAAPNQSERLTVSPERKQTALKEIEQKIADANRAGTVGERERRVDKVQRETEAAAAQSGITKEEVATLASKALVVAAASDAAYQQQVANVLFGLAASLPSNPRQIKRIINAFAIYETVGRLYFNYRLTASARGDNQSLRWRQLAIWTTLATEWPQTWRDLAREPRYVEAAYDEDVAVRTKLRDELLDGKSEDAKKKAEELLQRLANDVALSRLLCMKNNGPPATAIAHEQAPSIANMFANVRIDADAIYEFNRIMWEPGFPTSRFSESPSAVTSGEAPAAT